MTRTSDARAAVAIADLPPASSLAPTRSDLLLGALAALAVVLAGLVLVMPARADPAGLVAIATCALVSPALWRIDVTQRRLPNALTLPALAVGLVAAIGPALRGDLAPLGVGVGIGAGLLLLSLVGGMGMGDVKLGAALALATSTFRVDAAIVGLVLVFMVGGVAGVVSLVRKQRKLVFGPFLILGFALGFAIVVALG